MKTNNLTVLELSNLGFNDSDFRNPNITLDDLKEFSNYVIEPRYTVSFYDGKYYAEYKEFVIVFDGLELRPYRPKYNENKFIFMLPYNTELQRAKQLYFSGKEQPNKIGKPTDKKLKEWANYLRAEREFLLNTLDSVKNKIEKHKAEFSAIDGVRFNNDGLSGEVVKNGIRLGFRIDKDSGYLSTNIEVYYAVGNTIENFLKLSDNKY